MKQTYLTAKHKENARSRGVTRVSLVLTERDTEVVFP